MSSGLLAGALSVFGGSLVFGSSSSKLAGKSALCFVGSGRITGGSTSALVGAITFGCGGRSRGGANRGLDGFSSCLSLARANAFMRLRRALLSSGTLSFGAEDSAGGLMTDRSGGTDFLPVLAMAGLVLGDTRFFFWFAGRSVTDSRFTPNLLQILSTSSRSIIGRSFWVTSFRNLLVSRLIPKSKPDCFPLP